MVVNKEYQSLWGTYLLYTAMLSSLVNPCSQEPLLFQIQTDIPFCLCTPDTIKITGTAINTQAEANCLGV